MVELRGASVEDLLEVTSWIRSPEDCHRWAGNRLRFPIDRAISLNVDSANVVAVALYRSLHFAQADRPEDEPHSDALYMELVT